MFTEQKCTFDCTPYENFWMVHASIELKSDVLLPSLSAVVINLGVFGYIRVHYLKIDVGFSGYVSRQSRRS